MRKHYYNIKYPYLNYPYREENGEWWMMYSIPVVGLVEMYRNQENCRPETFFDCGCATGELIQQAEEMGIFATGIDVKQYIIDDPRRLRYFEEGRIQIRSILDTDPINADMIYCNGTLTYMNTTTLPLALKKFKNTRLLIAIHNTTEDIRAAAADGWNLLHGEKHLLIRSRKWWMETFRKNGFDVIYNSRYNCFCATPTQKTK